MSFETNTSFRVHSANNRNNSESSLDSAIDERHIKSEVVKDKTSIGRVKNHGEGGLAVKTCSQLFQNCDTCLPSFEGCEVCVGGFENVAGECLHSLQFDELECDPQPRDGCSLPSDYFGFSFGKDVLVMKKWIEDDEDYYGQTGFTLGVVSEPNTIFGSNNSPIQMTLADTGSTFSVHSLRITPVFKNNMTIKFKGFIGEMQIGEQTVVLSLESPDAPHLVALNDGFQGITMFEIDHVCADQTDVFIDSTSCLSMQIAVDDIVVYKIETTQIDTMLAVKER